MANPDYQVDDQLVRRRGESLAAFWGRDTDLVLHQTDDEIPHIDVYRFPIVDLACPVNDMLVYNTGGMADLPQPMPDQFGHLPARIELTAYSPEEIATESGDTDFIGWILHWLAHYPLRENRFLAAGQTFNVGRPLVPGSEMTAYYLAHPPFVDGDALVAANLLASGVIHLVPISEAERLLAINDGVDKLLETFGACHVAPFFDLQRPSCV